MKQAIHIFKKDLRYLWREIFIVLLLAFMFSYSAKLSRIELNGPVGFVFLLASCWMIARLIQAEMLVGDNQFWITRPYSWSSLFGARIAFIFTFVQIPILLMQLAILIGASFPLWSNVPGLLWTQLLFWICMSFPLAALASATSGLVPLVLTILVVPVAGLAVELYFPFVGLELGTALGPLEWIKDTVAYFGAAVIAGVDLYFQYRKRATIFSRVFLGGATALVWAAYICLPWPIAFGVQSRLGREGDDLSSLRLRLAEHLPQFEGHRIYSPNLTRVPLRLSVDGLPSGDDVRGDAIDLQILFFGGRVAALKRVGLDKVTIQGNNFDVIVEPNRPLLPVEYDAPVRIRGSIYLTVFGNTRRRSIPMDKKPVNVIDSLQCFLAGLPAKQYLCRAPFRWPAGIVSAAFSENNVRPLGRVVSYSPFPASLSLNPVEVRAPFGTPSLGTDVTISIKEPLAHIRRDFEFTGIQIANSDAR